jgi:hypothetical protein
VLKSDASQLRNLAKQLRTADARLYRAAQRSIRAVGDEVAERARRNAEWSTRIPPTVTTRASGVTSVIVRAGGAQAPEAKPLEHAGAEGTFRHPVFGNRQVWVDQPARPFLHPAALEHLQEDAEAVAAALSAEVERSIEAP